MLPNSEFVNIRIEIYIALVGLVKHHTTRNTCIIRKYYNNYDCDKINGMKYTDTAKPYFGTPYM